MWGIKIRVCPASQNFRLSVWGGGAIHPVTIIVPHPSFVMFSYREEWSLSPSLFSLSPPLSPRCCELLMERQVSKHLVLWLFPPPVVSVRCRLTQPNTLPPRSNLGDLMVPPYRGDQPLRLIPGVLSRRADRLEQRHQHQEDLRRVKVQHQGGIELNSRGQDD